MCVDYRPSYKTSYRNCLTCRRWDHDDLICLNKEEVTRRGKERYFDEMEKMMRSNKSVSGPL